MKNLNKKLSVIALSGMAVFGGVAASAVPAFASGVKLLQEEQLKSDSVVEEIDRALEDAMGYFKVVGVANSKSEAIAELKLSKYSNANIRNVISIKNGRLKKVLRQFLWQNNFKYHAFAVSYKGKCYIIQVKGK